MFIGLGNKETDHIFFELQQEYYLSSVDRVKCYTSIISFKIGGFQGNVEAIIGINDLNVLLKNLHDKVSETIFFYDAVNEVFELKLYEDKLGHIKISGKICDKPGSDNILNFSFLIDQIQLENAIDDISKIIRV